MHICLMPITIEYERYLTILGNNPSSVELFGIINKLKLSFTIKKKEKLKRGNFNFSTSLTSKLNGMCKIYRKVPSCSPIREN